MAKEKATEFGIADDFKMPDKRRRTLPSRLADGQTLLNASFGHRAAAETETLQAESLADNFRRTFYYALLDLLLNELQKRFSSTACKVMTQLSAFCPSIANVIKFASRYDVPRV